ncbi:adenylate cyclase [Favolaschia claudopus]|uniref:Adenylate cyclase n=1 Tax=Favolaschia claudopus TaxID=2862362 RepID=A0AAV9ZAV7_9AGAR
MLSGTTSKRGSQESSNSPYLNSEQKLRKSKSTEFLHQVHRKLSLKSLRRNGRNSTDESVHPSLRTASSSVVGFQPPVPKRRLLRSRAKRSADDVPPIPPRPAELDEMYLEIDMKLDDEAMAGIVDPGALYPDTTDASSPASDLYSSSQSGHSSSRYGRPTLRNPFSQPPVSRIRSLDLISPTDRRSFPIPDSWAVTPAQIPSLEAEEESMSDDGRSSGAGDLPRWKIRIYGPDNNDYILRISADDTVQTLTPYLDGKLPAGEEHEKHELYLRERGRERILSPNERPAKILRRCLQHAGYDESDGDAGTGKGAVGLPGVPFLLKFVYRSQFLGPADDDLSLNNFAYVNLIARSLVTIPVVLHQHADTIVSLRLSRNPLNDIPGDFMQSCTALSELYLSHTFLKKVPPSIRLGATLTLLDLSSNRLASLNDAGLDELPRLATLNLQNNRLERLLDVFPPSLLNLNVSNNKFGVFPLSITKLPNLSRLDISFNSIRELPQAIGRLTRLTKLVVVGNRISGLPDEFRSLVALDELDCRRNQITDLEPACQLPELAVLSADHNNLHTLPRSIGPMLHGLNVSHNHITELVVGSSSYSFALTCLDISNAKISVLSDITVSRLPQLRTLKLDRNSLRGLPDALGDLKWLETLSCADNSLSGIPETLGKLQKLESLDLHNNSITELPQSLWNCASLSRANFTSNLLAVLHDPPSDVEDSPTIPVAKLPSPTFAPRRPSVVPRLDLPPLAHSLEVLNLAENSLTDEMLPPLMIFKELRVLNLSLNDIQELPSNFFHDLTLLEEIYLSGNRLTHFPGEDLPRLERLSTLFLNGNHLQHLPHELGQVNSLSLFDVGNNLLKYNINNIDYDWNWNFNKNLVYLNLSGNKQLQIKSDMTNYGRPSVSSADRQSFSGFSALSRLRVLGLMDVTITNTTGSDIPDEGDDRRIRTSSSLVNGLSYGIADTLGKNRQPLMMDLVHEFRGFKKDTVFAMFGRSHPANQAAATTSNPLAKYLKDNFVRVFITQLSALDRQRGEGVPDALRRSFLKLNQEHHDSLFGSLRRTSGAGGLPIVDASQVYNGASGVVVYIDVVDKRMYIANAGNALAIVSRRGTAIPVSRKHEPWDRTEAARIRAAQGWISPSGLVGDELDISRSFGFYHLLPMVNARPDIFPYELTSLDDIVIIANRGLWDFVTYQTAVDLVQHTEPTAAAQKLRDVAISYGAEGSTMVMVVSLANLFHDKSDGAPTDRRRRRAVGVVDRILDRLKDEVPPPVGHVAIVFTDIKGSTHLWEATPSGMITAIHLHNNLLRRYLRICGGYEVRTEGDSFMCSFPTVLAAVWWCLTVQVELLKVSWPQDILDCPDGREIYDVDGRLMYRGLSIRIGIHCGSPLCLTDPVTNRMDYFGILVTRAARIASVAAGGQIMFSADVLNELNARIFQSDPAVEYPEPQPKEAIDGIRHLGPSVFRVGEMKLKGLEVPETLSFVLPSSLLGRSTYIEPIVVNPPPLPSPSLRSPPPSDRFELTQVRELARLCVRLEIACADPALYSLPGKPDADADILLPANTDLTDSELSALLYSLTIRIENTELVLRHKLNTHALTKNAIVSALRDLDERTLEELRTMLQIR